jgi:hypothetical protein
LPSIECYYPWIQKSSNICINTSKPAHVLERSNQPEPSVYQHPLAKGKRKRYKNAFESRMKRLYDAVPWSYEYERDPASLQSFNGFGQSLFVCRHKGKVDATFKSIFQDVITNDPGLKCFKTYYCVGTGDVFYLGMQQSENMRFWHRKKSKLQSEIDLLINEDANVKELVKAAKMKLKDLAKKTRLEKVAKLKEYDKLSSELEKLKQKKRLECVEYSQIESLQSKINYCKTKLHMKAIRFECSFALNLDPQLVADQKFVKKKPKELDKSWKQTSFDLAHGACRKRVIRKTGRLGKVYVKVGEACSTMQCPVCNTLHSPGIHYLHSCPSCGNVSVRDESGRNIAHLALIRAYLALQEIKKRVHLNETEGLNNGQEPILSDFW